MDVWGFRIDWSGFTVSSLPKALPLPAFPSPFRALAGKCCFGRDSGPGSLLEAYAELANPYEHDL